MASAILDKNRCRCFMDLLMSGFDAHEQDRDEASTLEFSSCTEDPGPRRPPAARSTICNALRRLLAMSGFHSCYCSTDFGRLHYFDSNPGSPARPAILLHGLGASSLSLMPVACFLRREHRVIVPDLMHFAGISEPSSPLLSTKDHVTTIEQLAQDLALREFDLCGHSLGGGAAIHLAARQPQLVRTLSLINPGGFSIGFEQVKARFLRKSKAPTPGSRASAEFRRFRCSPWSRSLPSSADKNPLYSRVLAYLDSIQAHDFVDCWIRHIACPTLLLWGERDDVLPADIPCFIASEMLHAEIHRIPRAGHLAVIEAPFTVARHLCRFWQARQHGNTSVSIMGAALESLPVSKAPRGTSSCKP